MLAGRACRAADIAAALLVFTPAANANGAGYASFTFQVQDDGGTANGGVDTDQSANTITVDVTPVNDAPAGADKTVTTNEDTAYTFARPTSASAIRSTVRPTAFAAVMITTLPGAGALTLNGVAVSAGQIVSAADIAAGKLVFTPGGQRQRRGLRQLHLPGAGRWRHRERRRRHRPERQHDHHQRHVRSTTRPPGTDNTVTTNEDDRYTFAGGRLRLQRSGRQPGQRPLAVKITTLPGAGALTLNGIAVSAQADLISAADIAAGKLVFTPAANANGAGYASFTFQVQDDGGTANGGVDTRPERQHDHGQRHPGQRRAGRHRQDA